jgi:hypothetical protein
MCVLGGLTSCRSPYFLSLIFCPTVVFVATEFVLRCALLGFRRLRHTPCGRATPMGVGARGSAEAVFHRDEPGGEEEECVFSED